MEHNEQIEEMQKIRDLIMSLAAVVYAQSCFIQILGQQSEKASGVDLLVLGSEIHRTNLRAKMKNLGIDCKELSELDEVMTQFKEYQKSLVNKREAFKKRRAAINRGELPPQEPGNEIK